MTPGNAASAWLSVANVMPRPAPTKATIVCLLAVCAWNLAPLTTAILASVDDRHTGSASGLNSAVSRTGGMVATALLGGVLGAAGPALVSGFHAAAIACAIASVAASASAFFLIPAGAPKMNRGSDT